MKNYRVEYFNIVSQEWANIIMTPFMESAIRMAKIYALFTRVRVVDLESGNDIPGELLHIEPQDDDCDGMAYDEFYRPTYNQIIQAFGEVLLEESSSAYQGDTWAIIKSDGKIGYLTFGWGSCSGCDALEGCHSVSDVVQLVQDIHRTIRWFDTPQAAYDFFNSHDWEGEFCSAEEDHRLFLKKAMEVFKVKKLGA